MVFGTPYVYLLFVGGFLILLLYYLIPNSIYHIVVSHQKKIKIKINDKPKGICIVRDNT